MAEAQASTAAMAGGDRSPPWLLTPRPADQPDRRFEAHQRFVLAAKVHWSTQLYPALKAAAQARMAAAAPRGEPHALDASAIGALLADEPLLPFYAWLERHLQQMKYAGRDGLVAHHARNRGALESWLAQANALPSLQLDPTLQPPPYYGAFDVHQHPGGLDGDTLAGIVYEHGARSTTPLLQRHQDLHHRLTQAVRERTTPRRLLDLGCGFGKSTEPFAEADRELPITAVDLSAPCLRLAALNARAHGHDNVRFLQSDAVATGLDDAAYDTVTSTMLLHELPPPHLKRLVAETHRLLAPGGWVVHLDFLVLKGDAFDRFIHHGHGERNNEPFMQPLDELDLAALHRQAGFREVQVLPFEEAPGTLDATHTAWRFPWALFAARK
jgi:ubiquinone/menaquinone biosynthesis C-methylase UbiE